MAQPTSSVMRYEEGDAWLAESSADPKLVRLAWDDDTLAPIDSGARWLVAEARLISSMPALTRIPDGHHGPVLADTQGDRAWWLVPLDAAEELAYVRAVSVKAHGWSLDCPPSARMLFGYMWLCHPDGTGQLTDPAVLAAVLGPGGYRYHVGVPG
ncbi:hypothetical protein ACFWPQ_39565 [Streptomyces sp. NPDC058464]|uniref:hypothetical protein n=1 Tax=Streptomyces sp. NPDC058464 TaxID=3346511 RepID=UPI00364A6D12